MKKFLVLVLLLAGITSYSQETVKDPKENAKDLTGTWEGQFIVGTIGTRQPARMVLEIVQVEGRLYGIFDLYPVDTRANDVPNITYTVEGKCKPETVRYTLFQGRVVEGRGGPEWVQFTFELKSTDDVSMLEGKWFRQMEPANSQERGAGTFTVKRVANEVSDRLKLPKQEKYILQKLEKQDGK
jgi:hypothetical protein